MIDITLYTPDVTLTPSNFTSPSIWDVMLKKVSRTKYSGHPAVSYSPYYALAPCNQETLNCPVWRLGKFRGYSPGQVKLAKGSAICLQDVSQREHPFYPNLPTLFGTLVCPLWREGENIVYEVDTHIYSYTLIPAPSSLPVTHVAIPDCLVVDADHISSSTSYPGRKDISLGSHVESKTGERGMISKPTVV
jgi:hypothetical protein